MSTTRHACVQNNNTYNTFTHWPYITVTFAMHYTHIHPAADLVTFTHQIAFEYKSFTKSYICKAIYSYTYTSKPILKHIQEIYVYVEITTKRSASSRYHCHRVPQSNHCQGSLVFHTLRTQIYSHFECIENAHSTLKVVQTHTNSIHNPSSVEEKKRVYALQTNTNTLEPA